MSKEREHYQREKDRYYREKQIYEQANYKDNYMEVKYINERTYRERKDDTAGGSRHSGARKYDEKKVKETREIRYTDKHRRERYEEEKRDKADKTLQDLRERLLSKRFKGDDENYRQEKGSSHRDRRYRDTEAMESALEGAAGVYVKEIINISTGDERRYKKEERHKEEDKLTEEERNEQEMRREKLLEAGR